MNNIHIMLDLETWGRTPGSDIRSIGACVFDPVKGAVWNSFPYETHFYVATENPLGSIKNVTDKIREYHTLQREPATVQWWNDQSAEAQAAFANPIDLRQACIRFSNWLNNQSEEPTSAEDQNIRLWCNGPHFDEAILAAVYRAVLLPVPWHYRAPRDFRTITEAAGMTSADYSNYGEAHNALDDAIAQAMTVCEAYKRLGLQHD